MIASVHQAPPAAALTREPARVARAVLIRAGPEAVPAAEEFFAAQLRNPHTRKAYGRAVRTFLCWAADTRHTLASLTPADAGLWLDLYGETRSIAAQKQALAALRQFFDTLTVRHAVRDNPFRTVRGPRAEGREGRTPEITVAQVRHLLASITGSRPLDYRDRAVIRTLAFTGARVGALSRLRHQDLCDYGEHRSLRFLEKGGRFREIPVRLDLDASLSAYLTAGDLHTAPPDSPLFRAGRYGPDYGAGTLSTRPFRPASIRDMLTRRLRAAALPTIFSPHSFRVMVINDLLTQGVPMEDVQYLAGHAHPSTTQIYDRRNRSVSRHIVERISV